MSYQLPKWDSNTNTIDDNEVFSDSQGDYPSRVNKYVGSVYFHPKSGHLYEVVGICFQSEDNRWMVCYSRVTKGGLKTGPMFTHRLEDFLREGRFLEVKK